MNLYQVRTPDRVLHTGVSRVDPELLRWFYQDCIEDGQSNLYRALRSAPTWSLDVLSTHETLEEARAARGPVQWPEWPEPVATIYRIACRDGSVPDQYIGQTIHFDRRRWDHFLGRDSKLYDFIRDHGGWPNWKMSVVRQYPSCRDKCELDRLEWHWWNTLGGSLNSVRPGTHTHLWRGSDQDFEARVHQGLPTGDFFKKLRSINL
jgi:hypothetical protein